VDPFNKNQLKLLRTTASGLY